MRREQREQQEEKGERERKKKRSRSSESSRVERVRSMAFSFEEKDSMLLFFSARLSSVRADHARGTGASRRDERGPRRRERERARHGRGGEKRERE